MSTAKTNHLLIHEFDPIGFGLGRRPFVCRGIVVLSSFVRCKVKDSVEIVVKFGCDFLFYIANG